MDRARLASCPAAIEGKRGRGEAEPDHVDHMKREDGWAVARNARIESKAGQPTRKQTAEHDDQNHESGLAIEQPSERGRAGQRNREKEAGILRPYLIQAADIEDTEAEAGGKAVRRRRAAPDRQ